MIKKILFTIFIALFATIALSFLVKGGEDLYHFQNKKDTRLSGPFESTNSTSRFALTESIVKDKTFEFNEAQRRFSSPDLVKYNDKFFTIFTPGVSFFGVPFYMLGEKFGLPQLFSYSALTFMAVVNALLVALLANKLGAKFYASILAGLIFLFGTNALSYALTYTQHTLSVTVVILALLNAIGDRTWFKNLLFGIIFGAGILIDVPNAIFMLPIGFYIFYKHFSAEKEKNNLKIKFKLSFVAILLGLMPLLFTFGIYNKELTGSYTKIGQMIGRIDYVGDGKTKQDNLEVKSEAKQELVNTPYYTRFQLAGFYTLLISDERSWIYYSPVVLLGFLGLYFAYQQKDTKTLSALVLAVALMDIVSYTMFGDPWGGWSFGPRYLIPAAAVLTAALGVLLEKYKKNLIFILIFTVAASYSVAINTLGALTTNAIPPKVEAIHFPEPMPYTYKYNFQIMDKNQSSSLLYNIMGKNYMNLKTYWYSYTAIIMSIILLTYIINIGSIRRRENE